MYVYIYICIYVTGTVHVYMYVILWRVCYTMAASGLPVIHEWSTGYTRVVCFDKPQGHSPTGLSKLTMSVNQVDHKQTAIV